MWVRNGHIRRARARRRGPLYGDPERNDSDLATDVLASFRPGDGRTHPHRCTGVSGPVLIPLCGSCTSPVTGATLGTAGQIADLKARNLYVNVHTSRNPGGEIRGQITRAL